MFLVVLIYYPKSQVAVRRGLAILYLKSLQVATVFSHHGSREELDRCDHNFSESHQFNDVCTVFETVSEYIGFISLCSWLV